MHKDSVINLHAKDPRLWVECKCPCLEDYFAEKNNKKYLFHEGDEKMEITPQTARSYVFKKGCTKDHPQVVEAKHS